MNNEANALAGVNQSRETESSTPLIGIAIPAYRAADTLEETLRSCQAQTWTNWVAFVTVEGEDATPEMQIAERLADPRIHLECNGRRLGQMANFNRAMMRCYSAGAAWIKLMSADDLLHPDALDRLMACGDSNTNCGLVYGYHDMIDESGTITFRPDLSRVPSRMLRGNEFLRLVLPEFRNPTGGPSNVMIRAEVIETCGLLDDAFLSSGDRDYWYRIAGRHDIGCVGEKPILSYRRHSNSVFGRLHMTSGRMEEDADIGRRVAARYAPWSRNWWLAQRLTATAVASNIMACMAMIKQGKIRAALSCFTVSLRRLSFISAPFAIISFFSLLTRRLLTGHAGSASAIDPGSASLKNASATASENK